MKVVSNLRLGTVAPSSPVSLLLESRFRTLGLQGRLRDMRDGVATLRRGRESGPGNVDQLSLSPSIGATRAARRAGAKQARAAAAIRSPAAPAIDAASVVEVL